MSRPQPKSSQKIRRILVRPGEELRWLHRRFLPAAAKLYAALAQAGVVPTGKGIRGRPRRKLTRSVQAVYWKEQEKLPMFRVGAMVEASGNAKAVAIAIAKAKQSPVERERLEKLGRNYVRVGRAILAQQQGEDEWPPPLVGKSPVPPRALRKHFQEMTLRAVAKWLTDEARAYCDTDNPVYGALVEVLGKTSVMSRITWLLQPD